MKSTSAKTIGRLLILVGVLVVAFSKLIVFPGLERVLGIETIVGHDNVVYRPDGSSYFTNPGAMIRWIFSVVAVGILICSFGCWQLFRTVKLQCSDARKRYRKFPLGTWASYLGGGHDGMIGMRLTFHKDGTGSMEEWGFDELYNPAYVSEPTFQWKNVGDWRIEISHRGKVRTVAYDFKTEKNVYGIDELRIFEPGLQPDERGEVGFWISPFSLVHQPQPC